MNTIGYGDIVPITKRNFFFQQLFIFLIIKVEKLFVTLMTFVTCLVFAYVMNFIGDILKNFAVKHSIFKRKIAALNIYMNERGLSKSM